MSEDEPPELAEEERRLRQLRMVVDFAANVLAQGRLDRAEAEALIGAARRHILTLFPDKEDTYELILAPRFARLLDEYAADRSSKVLPFLPR